MHKLDESLLSGIPPFRKLERAEIREILDAAQALRFDGGVAVFSEGMAVERFFLLLDGHIRVVRTTPGGEQIIALHIAPGQLFGIGAAIGRTTYPATAMTADDCVALAWPNRLWPVFVERYEGFATETYRIVGDRVGAAVFLQDALIGRPFAAMGAQPSRHRLRRRANEGAREFKGRRHRRLSPVRHAGFR